MLQTKWVNNVPISSWREFTQIVRLKNNRFLKRLDAFPNAILVSGCQRSGTTMLSRILTNSAGMTNYWSGKDDELDAALILSGYLEHTPRGRYCFQTTYLDNHYYEYYEHHGDFKIIWVLRNPYSVVTSLLYNWKPHALERAFNRWVAGQLRGIEKSLYFIGGSRWINPTLQASHLYKAKTSQVIELVNRLDRNRILIVDYDELVLDSDTILRHIYEFVDLEYNPDYAKQIHNQSIDKKSRLSRSQERVIENLAVPIYQRAQSLKSISLHQTTATTIPAPRQ